MEDGVYVADMDSETINNDFDEVDLYGTKMIGDDEDDNCEIEFE